MFLPFFVICSLYHVSLWAIVQSWCLFFLLMLLPELFCYLLSIVHLPHSCHL